MGRTTGKMWHYQKKCHYRKRGDSNHFFCGFFVFTLVWKMEIPKRTPRPVYKPTLYTPTQKPTHKPARKPTSTSTHKPTHRPTPESTTPKESAKCVGKMFATAQLWNGTLIAPDGSIVDYSLLAGARFPYVDHVYNEPGGIDVGFSTELCVRLNDNDYWLCEELSWTCTSVSDGWPSRVTFEMRGWLRIMQSLEEQVTLLVPLGLCMTNSIKSPVTIFERFTLRELILYLSLRDWDPTT